MLPGVMGVIALLCLAGCRVLVLHIALRDTKPAERPEIIRALNERAVRPLPRQRGRA